MDDNQYLQHLGLKDYQLISFSSQQELQTAYSYLFYIMEATFLSCKSFNI